MARFCGTIQGNRGEASRLGTEKSGLFAELDGRRIGVKISCFVGMDGKDIIHIYKTSGLSGVIRNKFICTINEGGEINYE